MVGLLSYERAKAGESGPTGRYNVNIVFRLCVEERTKHNPVGVPLVSADDSQVRAPGGKYARSSDIILRSIKLNTL